MKKISILLLICLCILTATTVQAQEDSASEYLVELGERSLEKGNVEGAIHEFSKALIVNPKNEKALDYLSEYGLSDGLYSGTQTSLSQKAELARNVKEYKDQLLSLEKQRFEIENKIREVKEDREKLFELNITKNLEVDTLEKKVKLADQKVKKELADKDEEMQMMEWMYEQEIKNLEDAIEFSQAKEMNDDVEQIRQERDMLYEMNLSKDLEMQILEEEIQHIRQLLGKEVKYQAEQFDKAKREYLKRISQLKSDHESMATAKDKMLDHNMADEEFFKLNSEYFNKIRDAVKYEDSLSDLSNKNHKLTKKLLKNEANRDNMFQVLEDYLYIRRSEINSLNDKLIIKQMEMAKNESVLIEKVNKLVGLYEKEGAVNKSNVKEELESVKSELQEMVEDRQKLLETVREKLDIIDNI